MTNKLTGREALKYMATGGWFRSGELSDCIYHLSESGSFMWYNNGKVLPSERSLSLIIHYGITPCPDPTVKVDEYEADRLNMFNLIAHAKTNSNSYGDQCLTGALEALTRFSEKWFQRKEQK